MSPTNKLLNQLLRDPSFAQWVHQSDPAAIVYWECWIAEHPDQHTVVETAAQMIRGVAFAPHRLPEGRVEQSWSDLQRRLATRPSPYQWWLRAAAVVLILLSGPVVWWVWDSVWANPMYTTAYGETKELVLPDGSSVTMNANSRLRYRVLTDPQPVREVYLEGEAFFSVIHRADHQPFVVRTRDLDVQVLGTEFNVNTRRGRTQVVLDDGRVDLMLPTEQKTQMKPGELAEYQADDTLVHTEIVDTERFIKWRDRTLTFDDTPLQEVALLLEENYGVEVTFGNPRLRDKRVSGEISAQKLDTILRALSKLFGISIQHTGNTVRIADTNVTS